MVKRSAFQQLVRLKKKKKTTTTTTKKPGFSHSSAGKESACNAGDLGSIPGLGRCPGKRKGYPLQYSALENSMDCIGHGVTKSQTQLRDFDFHWL